MLISRVRRHYDDDLDMTRHADDYELITVSNKKRGKEKVEDSEISVTS